jgi:hypothetical protein
MNAQFRAILGLQHPAPRARTVNPKNVNGTASANGLRAENGRM